MNMFTSEVMINKNKFPHQGQNELFNVDFDNNGWILDYLSLSMFVSPAPTPSPIREQSRDSRAPGGSVPGCGERQDEGWRGGSETQKI